MPIDASIISGLKPVQMDSPMNGLAKLLEVQGAQQNMQMGRMKMDEYQRGLTDESQTRDLTRQSGGDMSKLRELLYGAGNYKQGVEVDKTIAANKKAGADQQKAELEGHLKKFELAGQIMNGVSDQASYERARQQTAQVFGPEAAAKMPPEYNPQLIEENRMKAMGVKDQVEQRYKQLTFAETKENNLRINDRALQGQDVTIRGQDMTDQRARDLNTNKAEENRLKREEGKPLTEGQSKALLFGSRMREADKVLGTLATEGTEASYGQNLPVIGGAITAMSSGNQQMLKQAKTDFMTAVLRRESGAAISSGEFDTADKQYFPQAGDSPQVKEQKSRNRQLAIQGILIEVPEKQRNSLQPAAQPAQQGVTQPAAQKDGAVSKSKSGKPIVMRNGQWEYL